MYEGYALVVAAAQETLAAVAVAVKVAVAVESFLAPQNLSGLASLRQALELTLLLSPCPLGFDEFTEHAHQVQERTSKESCLIERTSLIWY